MNITNHRFYNKPGAGASIRQPSSILDQNYRLVFVYPMIISSNLTKYELLIRNFHSASMLKEIFISNSLNLVSMTSKIQGPFNQTSNIGELVGNVFLNNMSNTERLPVGVDAGLKYELEQKLHQKTERIKKYLSNDIVLKTFNPHIDFITLENLVDVPVIVGTKSLSVDVFTLLLLLVASIGLNRPLNTFQNLTMVINAIKSNSPKQLMQLLNNLSVNNKRTFIQTFLDNHPRIRYNFKNIIQKLDNYKKSNNEKQQYLPQLSLPNNEIFNILKFNNSELDQAYVFFKFMLDPKLFSRQFGITTHESYVKGVIDTFSNDLKQIGDSLFYQFVSLISTTSIPILRSIHLLLNPVPTPSNFSFTRVKDDFIDSRMNNAIMNIISDKILHPIMLSLNSNQLSDSNERIKRVKNVCQDIAKTENLLDSQFKKLIGQYNTASIDSYQYNDTDVLKFLSELEKVSNVCNSFNRNFQKTFSILVDNATNIFESCNEIIYNIIDSFISKYENEYNAGVSPQVVSTGIITHLQIKRTLIPQLKDAIFNIFSFFLYYRLQISLCQLVDVIELKIETAATDVLEWPNYTLILPIEIVQFLHTAILAKNWSNLVQNEQFSSNQNPAVSETYIKNIVKFIVKRLQIPNIVIIDEKKQHVYYKFMHNSNIIKTNISTIETFVNQNKIN